MTEIIPAILPQDFNDLRNSLAKVVGIAKTIQIDMCDGVFVETKTWPFFRDDYATIDPIMNEEEGLPFWDSINFEFDLMVMNAYTQFEFFTRLGAQKIIFHLEAEQNKEQFKEFLQGLDMYTRENISIGIAINTTTPIEELASFISYIDFVQCMGIEHIGMQGEPFDERVLSQIKSLRTAYPELTISVDGSVNEDTAPLLKEAGASRLVVGSALMQSFDIRETMRELESI